jgi:hypothetical protein
VYRIVDTSSLIWIREEIPKSVRTKVLSGLDSLCDGDALVYPPEVLAELERYAGSKEGPDLPLKWARKNETKGTRFGCLLDGAKQVLARVPLLIDYKKVAVGGIDDADPHVVALGVELRARKEEVLIVTNDFHTRPTRTSLADAAGVFGLPTVTLRTFLVDVERIWDGKEGT